MTHEERKALRESIDIAKRERLARIHGPDWHRQIERTEHMLDRDIRRGLISPPITLEELMSGE